MTFSHRRGKHSFPINVASTTFADPAQQIQLQVCDIVAGAATSVFHTWNVHGAGSAFNQRLIEVGTEELRISGRGPSTDVMPETGGTKGLDYNNAIEWVAEQSRSVTRPPQ